VSNNLGALILASLQSSISGLRARASHACKAIAVAKYKSGNVFHLVAVFYLATEFLDFRVSATFKNTFIGIGMERVFSISHA